MSLSQLSPETLTQLLQEESLSADTAAVIVAAGKGLRFQDERGKQYIELCGLPLICWSLMAFDRAPSIAEIVIVCAPDRKAELNDSVLSRVHLTKEIKIVAGGATRQESSFAGIYATDPKLPFVSIHDAARPLVTVDMIEASLASLRSKNAAPGAIIATRVSDTLKIADAKAQISSTPDRSNYWAAQTPQSFTRADILAAHGSAFEANYIGTDDASLLERLGKKVLLIEGSRDNLKLTMPEDLLIIETLMRQRLRQEGYGSLDLNPEDLA